MLPTFSSRWAANRNPAAHRKACGDPQHRARLKRQICLSTNLDATVVILVTGMNYPPGSPTKRSLQC